MNYSDITLKDALNNGIITIGKLDDDEWFIHEPIWRKAFNLAEKYHKKVNTTFIDDRSKPSIEQLQTKEEETFEEQLKRLASLHSLQNFELSNILLAAKL